MTLAKTKLARLFESRRFWAALGTLIAVVLNEQIGMDEATTQQLIAIVAAWIIGDSLNKT